jgi:protein SCO1/2
MKTKLTTLLALTLFAAPLAIGAELPSTADHDYDPPTPGTYTLPVIKAAADGEVIDSTGRPLRLRDLTHGRITVMSFIYTRCAAAKACPFATGVLLELHRLSAGDAALAKEMRLVSMSFDPMNDTPARMAAYSSLASVRTNAAPWQFITTRWEAQLQPILEAYGQAVSRKLIPSDPTGPLNHTLRVFLIDRAGRIRNIYSSGTLDARLVLADVRTLTMESPRLDTAPLTPEQAARKTGETHTVQFQVGTTVRVTDITDRENQRPYEVLLVDARNGDDPASPVERAGIVVRIPVTALEIFAAADMEQLASRFEGKTVTVTGRIEPEPHPFRHDAQGKSEPQARLTVTRPEQIQVEGSQPAP